MLRYRGAGKTGPSKRDRAVEVSTITAYTNKDITYTKFRASIAWVLRDGNEKFEVCSSLLLLKVWLFFRNPICD